MEGDIVRVGVDGNTFGMNFHIESTGNLDMKNSLVVNDPLLLEVNKITHNFYKSTSPIKMLNNCSEHLIYQNAAESDLSYLQNNCNSSDFCESVCSIENYSSYKKCSINKSGTDGDLSNASPTYVKEELILDLIEATQEFHPNNVKEKVDSNQICLKTESIPNDNASLILEQNANYEAATDEHTKCNEPDKQEDNTLVNTKPLKRKRKRNLKSKLLRMYCYSCHTISKDVHRNSYPKCLKCKKKYIKFQCVKCKDEFKSYVVGYAHVFYKCSNSKLSKCPKCHYKTWDKRNLKSHMKIRHGVKDCLKCGTKCKNYSSLKRHQLYECKFRTQKVDRKSDVFRAMEYYCEPCNKVVSKAELYCINQCKDCMQDVQMRCIKCKHQCNTYYTAYYHLKYQCENQNYYYCAECSYKTLIKSVLSQHLKSQHVLQNCDKCGMQCSGKTSLKKHKKMHKNILKRRKVLLKKVTSNFIELYCPKCEEVRNEKCRKTLQNCQDCSTVLQYQCKKCTKKYCQMSTAYNHAKYNCGEIIKCSLCEYSSTIVNLRNHNKAQHKVRICKKCGVKSESYNHFKQHQVNECSLRTNARVKCCLCDIVTTNKYMRNHMKTHHTPRNCPKCGIKCENFSYLKQHLYKECRLKENIVNCPMCDHISTKKNISKHIKLQHTPQICRKCGVQYENNKSLMQHQLRECSLNEPTIVKCPYCDKMVPFEKLEIHIKYHHTISVCPKCGMKCDNISCLKRHNLYECSLKDKQQVSDNDPVYDINVYCSTCTVAAKLIYGLKIENCSVCQTELKLQCGTCKRLFKKLDIIRNHIKYICNKEPSIRCTECNYTAKELRGLRKHKKRIHNIDYYDHQEYILP